MDYAQLSLINGESEGQLSVHDRGLMFADGVFETLVFAGADYRRLDLHLARLEQACLRLQFNCSLERVMDDLTRFKHLLLEQGITKAVVKLIVSRGSSQTAYRFSSDLSANVYLTVRPWRDNNFAQTGVSVRRCQQVLATQASLAGLKHLAKIEYVLARNEWQDDYHEGLLFDSNDYLIEATSANVFLVKQGKVFTPLLDQAGVEGVMKQQVLTACAALSLEVQSLRLTETDVFDADEIFLSNAVIGLWPLKAYQSSARGLKFTDWPICQALQAYLAVPA